MSGKETGVPVKDTPEVETSNRRYSSCGHFTTRVEVMPDGHTHHAREVCVHCGAFTRWLPRPETVERRRLNGYRLARLGMCPSLNRWEASFVQSVSQCKKLSHRQLQIIDRLCATHLERGSE